MTSDYIADIAPDIMIFGEVKRQFKKRWEIIINILIFLTTVLPLIIHLFLPKSVGDTTRWVLFIWLLYSLIGLYSTSIFDIKKLTRFSINILYFPLAPMTRFYIKTIVYFLKKKYPNTDDPNKINMFNRKLKLKNIL